MPGINDPANPGEARAERAAGERLNEDYSSEVLDNPEMDPMVDEQGEPIPTEGAPPKEPLRKSVVGISTGSVALLVVWGAEQFGLSVPTEVALAIAGIVGAIFAYAQREW